MTTLGSTRDFALFINEYFMRFAELLDGLAENGEASEKSRKFFYLRNLRVAAASIDYLQAEMDSPVLGMLQVAERVIGFSFRSGDFDKRDFKRSIENNQGDFFRALEIMKQQNADSYSNNPDFKQSIDLIQEFVRNNYREATFSEIRDWFAVPLMYDISNWARQKWKKENVIRIEDFLAKRESL